jgi:hypothetical protein
MSKRVERKCDWCGHAFTVGQNKPATLCGPCDLRQRARRHSEIAKRFAERADVLETIRARRHNPGLCCTCPSCEWRGTVDGLENKRRFHRKGACYLWAGECPDCQHTIEVAG